MKRIITTIIIAVAIIVIGVAGYRMSLSKGQNVSESESNDTVASSETIASESATDAQISEENSFQIISAEEAKKMMDEGNVTIVDVRRQDEYDAEHVKGAILVPNESIESGNNAIAPKELPDKDAVLLVYCRTGIRAAEASQKLVDMGYTNVYDFGGIVDWPYDKES